DLGLRWMIKFNVLHLGRSRWSLAETLTHEMGHVYQEEILKNGAKPPYHNKAFVDFMGEIGSTQSSGRATMIARQTSTGNLAG
ncbi:MAG: hypothetical protein AAB289_17615, partial [Chloroflexota bacterium]